MQCHLETTSSPLPHSILKIGREPFSYRPGEPLADYELSFDRKPGASDNDRLEVAQQAYRLRKSACFLQSQMTCLTCHDPHRQLTGAEAVKHYVAVCIGCHTQAHASGNPGSARALDQKSTCLDCHMWKRRTDDAVHVVMTDHYIQRLKPKRDLLAPRQESTFRYQGEVVPYYPDTFAAIPNGDLYLALAQTEHASNLAKGTLQLQQAIEHGSSVDPEFYFALGAGYSRSGQFDNAVSWYRKALQLRPQDPQALRALAATLAAKGDLAEAASVGEEAAAVLPSDTAVLTNLGSVYLQQGDIDRATATLQRALTIEPDLPDATVYLGLAATRKGDLAAAEALFRSAIRLQPDLATARNDLASLLAARGRYQEAGFHLQKAVTANPTDASLRHNYGVFLARTGSPAKALAEFEESVQLDPASSVFRLDLADALLRVGEGPRAERELRAAIAQDTGNAQAQLSLGRLLEHDGRLAEARTHYEIAAQSPDAAVRQAALDALRH